HESGKALQSCPLPLLPEENLTPQTVRCESVPAYGRKNPCVANSSSSELPRTPSGPESRSSTWPTCQIAASPFLTTPGASALAVVLTPQVLPWVVSAVGRQSSGIGKPMSMTVAPSVPAMPLSLS